MKYDPIFKIHKFVLLSEKNLDKILQSEIDLSFSQSMILVHIAHHPDTSQRNVAYERYITPAAVSRHIETLEALGFISRIDNEANRREHMLQITKRGEEIVKFAEKMIDLEMKNMSDRLSRDEIDQINDVFERLLSRFL